MAVSFQLPSDSEQSLRNDLFDLEGEAKEAFLISLYRRGRLSHLALSQALRFDRFETEDLLHKHNVTVDLGTLEDYLQDARTLEKLRAADRRDQRKGGGHDIAHPKCPHRSRAL